VSFYTPLLPGLLDLVHRLGQRIESLEQAVFEVKAERDMFEERAFELERTNKDMWDEFHDVSRQRDKLKRILNTVRNDRNRLIDSMRASMGLPPLRRASATERAPASRGEDAGSIPAPGTHAPSGPVCDQTSRLWGTFACQLAIGHEGWHDDGQSRWFDRSCKPVSGMQPSNHNVEYGPCKCGAWHDGP
jgi:hypothetical protein